MESGTAAQMQIANQQIDALKVELAASLVPALQNRAAVRQGRRHRDLWLREGKSRPRQHHRSIAVLAMVAASAP
jgi:hypothetical protein